ncbi:hypothetical protein D3C75_467450 [compost metagenome]
MVKMASNPWSLIAVERGKYIDEALGNNLGKTFPTADRLADRKLISIKSIDTTTKFYKNEGNLLSTIKGNINTLANFTSARRNVTMYDGSKQFIEVLASDYDTKVLNIAIPDIELNKGQQDAILEAMSYGANMGIQVILTIVK